MRNAKVALRADKRHVIRKTTRRAQRFVGTTVTWVMLLALALPLVASGVPITLTFEPTAMLAPTPPDGWPTATSPWPPNGTNPSAQGLGATGYMMINQVNGQTDLQFILRGARPYTLYTIWTVFRPLAWCTPGDPDYIQGCSLEFFSALSGWSTKPAFAPFAASALPFYSEASVVAPTASMAKAFTSGMGPDPGLTFYTNGNGDGQVHVMLDYNLLGTTYDDGPPVGNATTVTQCTEPGGPPTAFTASNCPKVTIQINGQDFTTTPKFTVTSSWLRKYIIQMQNYTDCANYNPSDPTSILWQCIDPATVNPSTGTGLPRVWRYPFDHFRLAAHPDQLTHGFIGGSAFEHVIDMVGRRCSLQLPGEPTC